MRAIPLLASCALAMAAAVPVQAAPDPTFSRDLAPLLYTHCVTCHRAGGSAPFSLLTWDEVRPRARQVVNAVVQRQMPPWKADGDVGQFVGDRRLPDGDVDTFRRWLAAGAPRGNPGDLPAPPPEAGDWELGPPDLVVRLERPYDLPAGGEDRLRNFVVRVPIPGMRYVRAWEFKTTAASVVHHATLMVDRGDGARRLDAETPESGYEGLIPFSAQSPDGYFLGWTPGQRAQVFDADMAWGIQPGNDLIVMLHMKPGTQAARVDASVALYFSDRPPSREPVMIRLNRQDLDIRAGDPSYAVTDTFVLPVDVDLYAVQPHAHNLATRVRVEAEAATGDRRSLLSISAWDFHWQDVYRYTAPIRLPARTRLSMSFAFDNSANNRANPSSPPVRVIWGQRSRDEMADVWLQVVPRRPEDRERLVTDLRRQLVPRHIDGYLKMLEVEPLNTALHDDLALLAIEAGDTALAAEHFGAVLRLKPASASAHYNVGNVLLMTGRASEALVQFRQTLGLDPAHGLAHQGLGLALSRLGRMDEAVAELERAARLLPDAVDVAYNLGVVNQQRGHHDDALAAYERVMHLAPAHAEARYGAALIHEARGEYRSAMQLFRESDQLKASLDAKTALAWLLATAPSPDVRDGSLAVVYGEGAIALAPRNPRVLDALAAALASTGRFDAAVQRAREALDALGSSPDPAFAAAVSARLRLYQSQQPFVSVR